MAGGSDGTIKVAEGLTEEVAALENAELEEMTAPSTDGLSSLPTCVGYSDACAQLIEAAMLYQSLVKKDAQELRQFIADMTSLDSSK